MRQPLLALIERVAAELPAFAPELVASPKASLYRIYRDTRFSPGQPPLKTNAAAIFPLRGFPRHECAGLYFEVTPEWVLVAGGIYRPRPPQLHAIRTHVATEFRRFRSIVESPAFRRAFGSVGGESLQRVPRGFRPDHEAAEYLKLKQFLVAREYPARFATSPRLLGEVLRRFRQMAPFVRFLNEPISEAASPVPPIGFQATRMRPDVDGAVPGAVRAPRLLSPPGTFADTRSRSGASVRTNWPDSDDRNGY